MTGLQSLLLGLVQGCTEFLPVSSSGHLALLQQLFGWDSPPLAYDLLLHGATMGATLLFFARDIFSLGGEWFGGFLSAERRKRRGWLYGWALLGGTLCTILVAFPLKDRVEAAFGSPWMVGGGLCLTGLLLLGISRLPRREESLTLPRSLGVGLVQGLAVFPGISRSGSTIGGALALGMSREEAFRFSFLLSIPAIAGAMLLQILDLGGAGAFLRQLPPGAWLGALGAFASGYGALLVLRRVVLFGRWYWFGIYCLVLGGGTLGICAVRSVIGG